MAFRFDVICHILIYCYFVYVGLVKRMQPAWRAAEWKDPSVLFDDLKDVLITYLDEGDLLLPQVWSVVPLYHFMCFCCVSFFLSSFSFPFPFSSQSLNLLPQVCSAPSFPLDFAIYITLIFFPTFYCCCSFVIVFVFCDSVGRSMIGCRTRPSIPRSSLLRASRSPSITPMGISSHLFPYHSLSFRVKLFSTCCHNEEWKWKECRMS